MDISNVTTLIPQMENMNAHQINDDNPINVIIIKRFDVIFFENLFSDYFFMIYN